MTRPQSDRQDNGLRPRCTVCNKPLSPGDFCDDLQCPNPAAGRDAAEGARDIARCIETIETAYAFSNENFPLTKCGEWNYLKRLLAAPPKLAPDAMREAIRKAMNHLGRAGFTLRDNEAFEYLTNAVATASILSAPVPPADGAALTEQQFEDRLHAQDARDMLRLIDFIADKIGLPHDEELSRDNFRRWFNTLSPSPAVAVEPVAWEYELATVRSVGGTYGAWEGRLSRTSPNVPEGSIRDLRPLYAAPPVRGDREKIARAFLYETGMFDTPEEIAANPDHPIVLAAYRAADRLSLPVQSGAGERPNITIYRVEEDDENLWVRVPGADIASVKLNSKIGRALLTLEADLRLRRQAPHSGDGEGRK